MDISAKRESLKFGRHQTFPLRFSWPTKGFHLWCEGHDVFDQTDPGIALGVGKNMVSAIKYWLQACGLAEERKDSIAALKFGALLFSPTKGFDPYLEDDVSLWLLHWNIASNRELATSFYWFFNYFHKTEFKASEVVASLEEFLLEKTATTVSRKTLESDIAVLLRMYSPQKDNDSSTPIEDSLQSPMTLLNLIDTSSDGSSYRLRNIDRPELPIEAFGYSLLDTLQKTNVNNIAISRLQKPIDEVPALGTVFKLNEDGLVSKLEQLSSRYSDLFDIRETAGIHQIYRLQDVDKFSFLKHYFQTQRNIQEAQ